MEKIPNWECLLFIENKDCSYQYTWMTSTIAGRKQELESVGEMSKVRSQMVDLTYFGLQTNLQDQSQNGQELVTDA